MNLQITESEQDGVTVLALAGEADVYTSPFLKQRITDALAESERNLVVDLSGLEYLDACGNGVLLNGLKRARGAGRDLSLRGGSERVRRIFSITGLDRIFPNDWTGATQG